MSSTGQVVGGIVGAVVGYFAGNPILGAQIGMTLGGAIDPPKLPTVSGPRLSDLSVQTSSYGVPLARVYGTVPIVGNIFWLENNQLKEVVKKKKTGGKGGPSQTTKTYSYYATFAVALCDTSKTGPILGVRRIWIGSNLWYNAGSDDLETIIAGNQNVGGKSLDAGGGIFGDDFWLRLGVGGDNCRVYLGTSTQEPDARMQADIGVDDCPAYRNTAYIVFYDLPLEKYSNSLQAAQVKVEIVTASDYSVYEFPSIDLSDSAINDYHQVIVGKPLAQVINISNAEFYLTATDSGTTAKQRANTLGGREITTEVTPLAGSFRGIYIKQDGSNTAVSGDYLSVNIQKIGDYYYNYHADRVVQKEGIIVQFGGTHIYVPEQLAGPTGSPPAALYSVTPSGADSFIDVDIFGGEIYALVFSSSTSTIYVNVYDQALALDRTISSTYVNTEILAADSDSAIFVTAEEICVYSGEDDRKFVFVDHTGAAIQSYVLPPGSLGSAGGTGPRDGMAVSGRLVWMWNSQDQLMLMFNLAMPASSTVPLADIVSAELQLSNLISPADIDVDDLTDGVRGYRIPGGSIRGAVGPLQGAFPFDLIPSGYQIKAVPRGQSAVATIDIGELGAVSSSGMADVVLDGPSREMDTQLPRKLIVKHLDADRDYDINEQSQERVATDSVDIETQDIALVMTPTEAAGMAQTLLYLRWLERNDYAFSLPPPYNNLEPADVIDVVADYATIPLRLTEINYGADGILQCKAKPDSTAIYTPNASGGQGVISGGAIAFAGDSTLILLDVPMMRSDLNEPGFIAAMFGESAGWVGGVAFRSNDNGSTFDEVQAFAAGGTVGVARGTLGADDGYVIDRASTLTVDWRAGTPESVTEEQILSGYNYYAYGADGRWEIIAIADIDLQGDGSYLCSTLLRGLNGTEWATGLHVAGDYLVLLDDPDNAFIGAGYDSFGVEQIWRGITYGKSIDSASDLAFSYDGVNLEPLSPVNIQGDTTAGAWAITWNRRSRFASSIWTTGTEVQMGETTESYEIDVMDGSTVIRTIAAATTSAAYTLAEQTTDFGGAQSTLSLKIYQLSETMGRGYVAETTLTSSTTFATVLLHFDGADASTIFTDSATPAHIFTPLGNAQIDTAQSMFGGASGLFDATGDYLTTPDASNLSILGDFTIECFVRRTAAGRDTIASKYSATSNGFVFSIGATDLLSITLGTGSYISATSAAAVPVGAWSHIAATKSGTTLRVFVDGVLSGSLAITGTVADSPTALYIGRDPLDASRDFGGHMDEFRFIRGVAMYTSSFTPPAAPFI